MIARCVDTDYSSLAKNKCFVDFMGQSSGPQTLKLGGEYLVVAIATGPCVFWLFLADRFQGLRYPLVYPANLFEIIQTSISRFWKMGVWIDNRGNKHSLLAPECWTRDELFHAKLFEGDTEKQSIYDDVCTMLYAEYALPWIHNKATELGSGNWVTDENHHEQWEANPLFAMTQHPKNKELLHNPIFLARD